MADQPIIQSSGLDPCPYNTTGLVGCDGAPEGATCVRDRIVWMKGAARDLPICFVPDIQPAAPTPPELMLPKPWYKRWYAIAGGVALVGVIGWLFTRRRK